MRRHFYRKDGASPRSSFTGPAAEEREARAAKAAKGRTRQRSGEGLEQYLTFTHHLYAARREAKVAKQYPAVRGPMNDLYYAGPGECDYIGWVHLPSDRLARPVAFDAKSCVHASFTLPRDPKDRRTIEHQIDFLLDFAKGPGALAFLLVVDLPLGCGWYLFPEHLHTLRREEKVALRTLPRRKTMPPEPIVHHVPHFPLGTVAQMARGAPHVDWRAGLDLVVPPLIAAP